MDDNSIYNVTNDLIFSGKRKKNQRMIYYFMKEEMKKKHPASKLASRLHCNQNEMKSKLYARANLLRPFQELS